MTAVYGHKTGSVECFSFYSSYVVGHLMGSACLLGQNIRQLRAQGGHALGGAEVIALHHAQNRLQRGLRIAPEVRLIAFAVYILHIVDEVERLTELEADAGVWKRPASHISDQLRASRRAADHKAVVKCPAIGHDALAGGAGHAVCQKKNRSAVFQQLSLKQLIVLIACPEGGKFFTQVRVGLGPIEHGSAPVGVDPIRHREVASNA